MNSVSKNRGLFLIVRTAWDLGSGFYTDLKFQSQISDPKFRDVIWNAGWRSLLNLMHEYEQKDFQKEHI